MSGKSKIALFVVMLVAVVGVAGLALLVPFTTDSAVKGYEYRVNTLRVNWYLLANSYSKKHSGVKIDLVETPQTGYRLTGKGGKVLQSVSATSEGDTLAMQVQYDPIQRENYARGEGGSTYSRDLYMYLCLAMQGNNPTPNDCYERADLQIARERWLPGATVQIVRQDDMGWRLVPRVHAQACAGMIACGGWTSQGQCSISGKVCSSGLDCGSADGSCVASGTQTCDTSLNPINCKTLTDKAQCETQGYVKNCNIGCNTSAENFCSWGGSGGGGSCPAECRQGSSCGTGYSGATGCSGAGPGGGCKTNQVCCSANSCGGGGGGTVQCVQPQDCPPGTVKSATVTSSACDPVCGNNAWGTGGTPGTAQSYTGCCQWETTGGGNCVWEPCPTKSNPNKVCKVCDPEETWCKRETVTTYECIPSCVTQNPSSVTLVSPADGANVGGAGVTLDWTGVSSWGVACDSANQYEVFVDTVPTPTTIYGVVGEGVTSDYFMGSIGQTYYWKIRAHNGSVYTDSAVRSFTLVANQITGTVYINSDASCGQGTPGNLGGALHLTWEDDDVQVNANGTYTLSTTVGGSGTLTLTGIPAGYICSPTCGSGSCSISGVDPAINGGGNNFYVTPSRGAWFQLEGAGAYAGSTGGGVTIRSLVPTSEDFILPGTLGSIGALMRASGSYDVESAGGELSTTGWNAVTRYKGKTLNYSYFAAREGVTLSQTNDWASDTIDEKVDDGRDFWYIKPSTQAVVSSPWTITGGDSLVVFVDGDLRIASNITVSSGSFLAFIVRGDITIDKSVTAVQGLYVADGVLTTESAQPTDDVQLNVQGSMVAWGGVSLSRDLGSANINTPAEKFGYRPDLIVNMPTKMKTYALEWSEVVPGTFGE